MSGGDGPLADGALTLDRLIEVSLRAIRLTMTSCAYPPGTYTWWKVGGLVTVMQLGDDSSLIASLDFEPHSFTQREDPLGTACIPLRGNSLGGSNDRVVKFVEGLTEVWHQQAKVGKASPGWA
jgi:hypothetical protein